MNFYLVRHGEAQSESEDRRRPLSERGRRAVEQTARAVAARGTPIGAILHSGKLRAKETAEILARHLGAAGGVRETGGLAPEDDPFIAKAEMEASEESLMLVGHLPHMARLAGLLLAGDADRSIIEFSPATVVCLARERGKWRLSWVLAPER